MAAPETAALGVAIEGSEAAWPGAAGDHQVGVPSQQAVAAKRTHFLDQGAQVDDHALAQHAGHASPQDAGRNQMRDVLLSFDDDGVAGVGASSPARHHVCVLGQEVYHLTLAFIAPLGSDNNYDGHVFLRVRVSITL